MEAEALIPCAQCSRFFCLDEVALGCYIVEALMCSECVDALPAQVPCIGRDLDPESTECTKCPDQAVCETWEATMEIKVTKEAREAAMELLLGARAERIKAAQKYKKPGSLAPFKPSLVSTFFTFAQREGGVEIEELKRMASDAGVDWSQTVRKIYLGVAPGWTWKFRRSDTHLFVFGIQKTV